MDKQEYLNQISAANRPIKAKSGGLSGLFSSKIFLYAGIFVAVLVAIMIFGSILGGSKGDTKVKLFTLMAQIENENEIIDNYRKQIKSSELRSYASSLSSVLSDGDGKISQYIADAMNMKNVNVKKNLDEETIKTLTSQKEELSNELFEAKINGRLDMNFALKMTNEVAALMNSEAHLINTSGKDELNAILTENYNSLKTLYDKFNGFSESK